MQKQEVEKVIHKAQERSPSSFDDTLNDKLIYINVIKWKVTTKCYVVLL